MVDSDEESPPDLVDVLADVSIDTTPSVKKVPITIITGKVQGCPARKFRAYLLKLCDLLPHPNKICK